MAITPPVTVPAPVPRSLRYGLFTAANGPLDLPIHGSAGGVQYEPASCGRARRWDVDCTPTGEKLFDEADATIEAEPFTVYATYTCAPVGHTAAEIEAKVRQRLANGEQTEAEAGFAAVLAAGATPIFAPDATDIKSVIGALQQWLYADQRYGNIGYLHMPPRFEPYMSELVERVGNIWQTKIGTVVVFGAGYPDGTIWISGQTTVWRSEVHVPPLEQTLDRTANQWKAVAEREYAVAYDCLAASAEYAPEVILS